MKKYDPDMLRALELRAIILNALDALECYDDPAPAAVDLIDIAMLLDQALDLLSPRRGKYTGLDKADAAIDELDRRLASIEPLTAAIIDSIPSTPAAPRVIIAQLNPNRPRGKACPVLRNPPTASLSHWHRGCGRRRIRSDSQSSAKA